MRHIKEERSVLFLTVASNLYKIYSYSYPFYYQILRGNIPGFLSFGYFLSYSMIHRVLNSSNLITKSSFEKCDSRIGTEKKVRSFILPELPGILNSVHTSRPQNLKFTTN